MRKLLQYLLRLLSILILNKYRPKIVAITGSVGKSSAKEAIFLVLEIRSPNRVRRNFKNLNTEIGVPLTIIGGEEAGPVRNGISNGAGHNIFLWLKNLGKAFKLLIVKDRNYPEILVLEMAADRPGDIKYLTSFVQPDIAVVTAIGEMPSHLEFFPELENYASEKSFVIKRLKPGGAAILNYDDLSVREFRNLVPTGRERIYYGFEAGAEVRCENFSFRLPENSDDIDQSGMDFVLTYRGERVQGKIYGTLGQPPLFAILAAASVGLRIGLSLKNIVASLEKYRPLEGRLKLARGIKETIILDDSYNASPLAMMSALEILAEFKKKRRLAVLGSMRELGINTEAGHRLVGQRAAFVADILVLVGDEMIFAKEEALKKGLKLNENLFWFETSDEAKLKVQRLLEPDDVILIKGSRAVNMEKVVGEIQENQKSKIKS